MGCTEIGMLLDSRYVNLPLFDTARLRDGGRCPGPFAVDVRRSRAWSRSAGIAMITAAELHGS